MKLSEYIKKKKVTKTAFAEEIGVAFFTLDRYLKGRIPEPSIMATIYKVTRGAVAPNDFYPLAKKRG